VVAVGRDVTLRCDATTDQLEYHNLRISWLFNGEKIEFGSRTNVAQNDDDVSLKITRAQVDNSGNYTCNASTALDWDDVTATLTVTGVTCRCRYTHCHTCDMPSPLHSVTGVT